MAIELKFDQHILRNGRLLKQCAKFAYSPLNELLCSLHVLQNRNHHGMLISWELEAQSKLDAALFQEMNYFSPFYEFGVPTFLTPGLYQNVHDIDEELAILKTKLSGNSSRVFVKDFITERKKKQLEFSPSNKEKWEWDAFGQSQDSLLDDMLANPGIVSEHFFKFIENYNNSIFKQIWKKAHIEDMLQHEKKRQENTLDSLGFPEMIHKLYNDKIVWNGKKVMIYQPFSEVHSISIHEEILFVPSYFIWPHLSVQDVNDDIVVTYDVNKHVTQQVSSQKMETILRAVGDSTRIQILNFLKQTENTTQGLSQLLNLSESTVSRDLNILKNAELVTSRRVNKYVLYQVTGTITDLIPSFFANLPDEYIT